MLLFLVAGNACAQDSAEVVKIHFDPFGIKEGLSQGFVSGITQDKDGFLWFTTKDGLDRYDGYHVTVYRNNPADPYSLPDNHVTQILEDTAGCMWVGTDTKGLCLFDRKTERFYRVKLGADNDTLVNNAVEYLHYQQGKILVTTANDVCIYDAGGNILKQCANGNPVRLKKLFSYNTIQRPGRKWAGAIRACIKWMPDNTVWSPAGDSIFIYTPGADMQQWSEKKITAAQVAMQGQAQYFVFAGIGNKVVFTGSNTISVYDPSSNKIEYKKTYSDSGMPQGFVLWNNTFTDNKGTIYFASIKGYFSLNLYNYTLKKYEPADYTSKGWFSGASQFVDRDGIIWVGTGGNGVYRCNTALAPFNTYPESAWAFCEDNMHNIYPCFRSGFTKFDLNLKAKAPIVPDEVTKKRWVPTGILCADSYHRLWLSAYDKNDPKIPKLVLYDALLQKADEYDNFLPTDEFVSLFFTSADNSLWILCNGRQNSRKLIHFDAVTHAVKGVYQFPIKNDYSTQYRFISGLWQDAKGVFWFGTLQGLFSFDESKQQWRQFINNPADTASLSTDMVFSLCPDPAQPAKYLWVGTNGRGLNRFDLVTGRCKRFTDAEGLPNNVVYGILSDSLGNLWMSTNRGLSCFNVKKETFKNFTVEDGLPGDEYNRYEFLKTSKGELFFGGVDGITWFNPADILKSTKHTSNVIITGLTVYNKPVNYRQDSDIINQPVQYVKDITLPYKKNMFTVEFALLKYTAPDKKHYRYRLQGFDKDWIDNGPKNTATFTNLDPGTYTLHVSGAETGEAWAVNETTVTIIILAPWYYTWWFEACVAVFVTGCIYLFYRYRLHQSVKVINMRNKIAGDLHDEIGSTLSSIFVYSEIIETKATDNDLKVIAERISSSSRNTLVAMSDIVWSINPKNDRFDNILLRMRSLSHEVGSAQNWKMHFNADEALNDIKLPMNERKNFYLIFKEALNNAVKYAHAKNVWIDISLVDNVVRFSLKDDGLGFDLCDRKEGNGLENMQKRAHELKGKLTIESRRGEGTGVHLRFTVK